MSLLKRLNELDHRIIFVCVFITIIFPLLHPILIPFPISEYTEMYWKYVTETIPEGSVVGFQNQIAPASDPQLGSGTVLTLVKLFERDCKIISFTLGAESIPLTAKYFEETEKILGRELVYGVDYVRLGLWRDLR